jgi:hypothetical protein
MLKRPYMIFSILMITGVAVPAAAEALTPGPPQIYWTSSGNDTIGEANLNGTDINQSFTTGSGAWGLAVSVPVAAASATASTFPPSTPQGTLSPPQTLTISNTGEQDLTVTGLTFTGPDPGDYLVGSNGCLGTVAPAGSCALTISFAPQGQGTRTATLNVATTDYANSPLQVSLSGTGGSLPQGATGPAGPAGAAGEVELATCKIVTVTVKKHGKRVKKQEQKCTTKTVTGVVKFTTTQIRAKLTRGQTVYATGTSSSLGGGRAELLLDATQTLKPGSYTLTTKTRDGKRWRTVRTTVRLE